MGTSVEINVKTPLGYNVLYPISQSSDVIGLSTALDSMQIDIDSRATATLLQTNIGTGWNGTVPPFTQTVLVPGILNSDSPIVDIIVSSDYATAVQQLDQFPLISYITTNDGSINIGCVGSKTTITLPIQLLCIRG